MNLFQHSTPVSAGDHSTTYQPSQRTQKVYHFLHNIIDSNVFMRNCRCDANRCERSQHASQRIHSFPFPLTLNVRVSERAMRTRTQPLTMFVRRPRKCDGINPACVIALLAPTPPPAVPCDIFMLNACCTSARTHKRSL